MPKSNAYRDDVSCRFDSVWKSTLDPKCGTLQQNWKTILATSKGKDLAKIQLLSLDLTIFTIIRFHRWSQQSPTQSTYWNTPFSAVIQNSKKPYYSLSSSQRGQCLGKDSTKNRSCQLYWIPLTHPYHINAMPSDLYQFPSKFAYHWRLPCKRLGPKTWDSKPIGVLNFLAAGVTNSNFAHLRLLCGSTY